MALVRVPFYSINLLDEIVHSPPNMQTLVCYRIPRTSMRLCVLLRSARSIAMGKQYADNQNISFLPAILSTSTRMHGECLRLYFLFLQARRKTAAQFNATELPSQNYQSDNAFRFKRAAFYQSLKSKVGLAAAKAAALRINFNVEGCGIVAKPPQCTLLHAFPFSFPSSLLTISLSPALTSA